MKRLWLVAVTVAFALIAAGFTGPASTSSPAAKAPISIGALTSLTGAFTPWGIEVRDGMQFAVNQINAKGQRADDRGPGREAAARGRDGCRGLG